MLVKEALEEMIKLFPDNRHVTAEYKGAKHLCDPDNLMFVCSVYASDIGHFEGERFEDCFLKVRLHLAGSEQLEEQGDDESKGKPETETEGEPKAKA